MQPKKPSKDVTGDLYRSQLKQIINPNNSLVRLAHAIDWSSFDATLGTLYVENVGRPGLSTRLMVGLHYLKYAFDESDESAVERWLENPYWQYFCGMEYFQHDLPLDPSSMTRWRQRIGETKLELMLAETIRVAVSLKVLKRSSLETVNVDTTVQEKAVAFPTAARLYYKARETLVREAKRRGIRLRQSYVRLGKRALIKQGQYGHARQLKRAGRETKRLRTMLGCVIRDIERKRPQADDALQALLARAWRIHSQQRKDKNKVYSMHAPEVECIAKGKAHKRYEFGVKVSVVSTSRDNWILGSQALPGNPFDGHTLKDSLEQAKRVGGKRATDAYVDRGYRGATRKVKNIRVHLPRAHKGVSRTERHKLRRRAAIEPIIGHLKSDNRLERNHLKGEEGDKLNALLAACGYNFRKLLRAFLCFVLSRLWTTNGPIWLRTEGLPAQT